jgi:WhiB family redox-sensing transcriptional regulator
MDRPKWQAEAACRGVGAELFFPTQGSMGYIYTIKTYCRHCPVRLECLAIADDDNGKGGIFGGLTANQRRALRGTDRTCTCSIRKCHLHEGTFDKENHEAS